MISNKTEFQGFIELPMSSILWIYYNDILNEQNKKSITDIIILLKDLLIFNTKSLEYEKEDDNNKKIQLYQNTRILIMNYLYK